MKVRCNKVKRCGRCKHQVEHKLTLGCFERVCQTRTELVQCLPIKRRKQK
jgi:hypothetical protein